MQRPAGGAGRTSRSGRSGRTRDARPQLAGDAWPKADRLSPGQYATQAQKLVFGLTVDDRARARGVIAGHAADRRLLHGRGVGTELEAVGRRRPVEDALHDARLDPRDAPFGVDLEDAVEVEAVDRDAGAESLPGKARGRAAHAQRHVVASRDLGRRGEV